MNPVSSFPLTLDCSPWLRATPVELPPGYGDWMGRIAEHPGWASGLTAQSGDNRQAGHRPALRVQDVIQRRDVPADDRVILDLMDFLQCSAGRLAEAFCEPGRTPTPEICQLQRTRPGGYFHWHDDVRVDARRVATVICYLSDAGSHGLRGGSTQFCLPDGSRVDLAPQVGRMVAFDPRLRHRGTRVSKGLKFALTMTFLDG